MQASEVLSRYGLDVFGVNAESANQALAAWVAKHPMGQAKGAQDLQFCLQSLLQKICLQSLLQKMEALDDGRSVGFRLSEDEAQIADVLIEAGTRFRVRRSEMTLRSA